MTVAMRIQAGPGLCAQCSGLARVRAWRRRSTWPPAVSRSMCTDQVAGSSGAAGKLAAWPPSATENDPPWPGPPDEGRPPHRTRPRQAKKPNAGAARPPPQVCVETSRIRTGHPPARRPAVHKGGAYGSWYPIQGVVGALVGVCDRCRRRGPQGPPRGYCRRTVRPRESDDLHRRDDLRAEKPALRRSALLLPRTRAGGWLPVAPGLLRTRFEQSAGPHALRFKVCSARREPLAGFC